MKLSKVLGYFFAVLGALAFCYGFTVAFMNVLDPATIFGMASSGTSVDFFSAFWSQIAGWTVLSIALFIVAGVGLYVGRGPKQNKRSNEQRIAELENSLTAISNRLNEIEQKQNQNTR